MRKRTIGTYVAYHNGIEVGYIRGDVDSIDSYVSLRTPIPAMYSSYSHSVLSGLNVYTSVSGIWDFYLVDEYDEYIL